MFRLTHNSELRIQSEHIKNKTKQNKQTNKQKTQKTNQSKNQQVPIITTGDYVPTKSPIQYVEFTANHFGTFYLNIGLFVCLFFCS